ncbi:hypothetical protein [Marinobacter sp. JSM 1782161]|uniref:hypothetical protein n=1 Tax=Marinobacter sp. JSM 1782161 TaxID=2685906 RepID=UPI001403AAAF|nr:hypothetical protein [Marinobacter sp. JSM 1782161]
MNADELQKFCAKQDIREWLLRPFRVGSDLCASNGHAFCLLRDQAREDYEEADNRHLLALIGKVRSSRMAPITATEISAPEHCKACKGSGKAVFEKCRECEGEGEVDAETDYNTYFGLECKSCGGDCGTWNRNAEGECPECDGSGNKPETEVVWLNDHELGIQKRYFALIKDLPGLNVGSEVTGTGHAVTFRFDHGEGAIMTINKPRAVVA